MKTFPDELWHQQETKKVLRLRRMIQSPCYDREVLDLRESLDLEPVGVIVVAKLYPLSRN